MKRIANFSLISLAIMSQFAWSEESTDNPVRLDVIHVTAEQQLQQSLGVSQISTKDVEKRPPANDVSELIRTMPGVNLTGNTATGQRGNKRQIDIRGMGPENTLILIDGKPVTSHNAERISMRGERNTRGDSNWVPVEEIESISVLRGPAAARYGSGAMGGVVNIKTKPTTNEWKGSLSYYTSQPEDDQEGATQRVGFNLSGPLIRDVLTFRLYGSANKTDADAVGINPNTINPNNNAVVPGANAAGVEGVRNRDIAGRLQWKINTQQKLTLDSSFSRQGNIYNGDSQNSNATGITAAIRDSGMETARLYRSAYSLTHEGQWDWGNTENTISYDRTTNSRLPEGLAGGPEGSYTSADTYNNSYLKNFRLHSEADIPFTLGVPQVLTLGFEYYHSSLQDDASMTQGFTDQGRTDVFTGINANRGGKVSQNSWALYAEDNIYVTEATSVIPAVRFDYNSDSGNNWSPSLNFSHSFNQMFTIKGGIARAYKAPNLYQTNPNFILYTRGQGCPINTTVRCYYQGNSNLKPETSVNKEIGLEFSHNGWQASINYFHNAYRNKIVIGDEIIGLSSIGSHLYQWTNTPKATIAGFEGNLVIPLLNHLQWSNNFTYMSKSEDYQGNPLSIIPKHTINSTLAWQATDKFDMNLTFTHYGRQKPRHVAINRIEAGQGGATSITLPQSQNEVGSYAIWGINAGYQFTPDISMRVGVTNLFDKKLYRTNNGAESYNEHGRAYYVNAKIGF